MVTSGPKKRDFFRARITRTILIFMILIGIGLVIGNFFNTAARPPLAEIKPRTGILCPASFEFKGIINPEPVLFDMELVAVGNFGDIEFVPATSAQTPCMIVINTPPKLNASGADWRLGINIPDPEKFHGQTVIGSFVLNVDSNLNFPNSAYYVHDGASGAERAMPAMKESESNVLTLTHKVSSKATVLQFWLRLVPSGGAVLSPGTIEMKLFEFETLPVARSE